MRQSTERILTTHTGSLLRLGDLLTMLYAKEKGESQDQAAFAARVQTAVAEIVRTQLDAGVDVVNDGEVGRISYATYVKDRLTGFGGSVEPCRV
jgi:5-methyltetrahydropteroyltriglutamate--homocysteine methyltransferase